MNISNETKVGALAIVVIVFFILGFGFLKGKKIFDNSVTLFAKYSNVQGLTSSNPVIINGLEVGKVKEVWHDNNMKELIVTLSVNKDINIPKNSIALIIPSPLSSTKIEIKLGDADVYLKNNDTLNTEMNKGLLDDIMQKVDPVLFEVKKAVGTLDSLLANVNSIISPESKRNISMVVENLKLISESILTSSNSLQNMLDNKNGSLTKTINNANSFAENLAANNQRINSILTSLDQTSIKFSKIDFDKTVSSLDSTINAIKLSIAKINSKEGSAGMLINDPGLYNNLTSTSNKLNTLLDDIRLHPKRYISVSVFGKKDKEAPLSAPLPDTMNAPYIKNN